MHRIAHHPLAALLRRQAGSLCGTGVVLGTLFLAASLTPSLVPRSDVMQGTLAGMCFGAGYGLGAGFAWLWRYMRLPFLPHRFRPALNVALAVVCLGVVVSFLSQVPDWQNSIRLPMGMEPVDSAHPIRLFAIAALVFAILLLLARLFALASRHLSGRAHRIVPRRVANVVGTILAALIFWTLANGVLFRSVLYVLDGSYREYDALIVPDQPRPEDPRMTGSAESLVEWEMLGRAGREFIASGPEPARIEALTGRPAMQPVRVYVGLPAADSVAERAALALEELKRQGGFDRSVLVVVTPTGTGWIDPAAMDTLEILHGGDVASVALQYSYLSSPLSLIVEPEYGAEATFALFNAIYDHWRSLPADTRPRFYLHGLSLGAMNSERLVELSGIMTDPVDGALWSGPPFESRLWRAVTDARQPGSPAWLPRYGDDSLVRFANQSGLAAPAEALWGRMRIVYLQYASDPITFFDPRDFYRPPAWLSDPRGPDVSAELRWYPVVTMLQLALDMAVGTGTPMGYGHVYAPQHYLDAWVAITRPAGWTPESLARLRDELAAGAGMAGDSDSRGG
ncbi:alpha/beta hydrolase [Paracoccus siganidrum]|uniref:Alpha/beta-hydrolase family protein n=1 Tax=Paracoccus siganidrum TaxID=1276757 RepID=A0A419A571_9RHOB|nr:alpha/beta-hydrolase family protein [Paracoccus siganidrum]RJL10713.1 hypothetical protein D3P05_13660 [Paracoccus siganidrum]RMC28969.1 hypothetical protein C9E82_20605 [Paracoccus siganidrum]